MIQTFTIQKATPSQNETDRMHWAKRRLVAKEWGLLLFEQITTNRITKAAGKRSLTVYRHGKRELDDGNLVGGLKQIIDEIVKLGVLVDDDPKHLSLIAHCRPLAAKANPHTSFYLEDME